MQEEGEGWEGWEEEEETEEKEEGDNAKMIQEEVVVEEEEEEQEEEMTVKMEHNEPERQCSQCNKWKDHKSGFEPFWPECKDRAEVLALLRKNSSCQP